VPFSHQVRTVVVFVSVRQETAAVSFTNSMDIPEITGAAPPAGVGMTDISMKTMTARKRNDAGMNGNLTAPFLQFMEERRYAGFMNFLLGASWMWGKPGF